MMSGDIKEETWIKQHQLQKKKKAPAEPAAKFLSSWLLKIEITILNVYSLPQLRSK